MGKVWDLPLTTIEGESLALSSTAAYASVKKGTRELLMYCSFAWRLALSPALRCVKYYDTSADLYTDYTSSVTDKDSSTHMPLDAMATGDYVYLGFADRVLGIWIDVGTGVNAVEASLDVEYSSTAQVKTGTSVTTAVAFTDVTGDSDGTKTSSTTLTKDGVFTWTLVADGTWKKTAIDRISTEELYWIRFCPSAALTNPTDINEIIPVYKNTDYGYMQASIEYSVPINDEKIGGIVALVASTTPTLYITQIK